MKLRQAMKHAAMSRAKASVDIIILLAVIVGVWSLRFFEFQYVGVLTMAAGITTVLILLRWRSQSLASIGWAVVFRGKKLISRASEVMLLTFACMLVGLLLAGAFFGAPTQSSAINQLPENFWLFLLDITLLTWLFIAFGEELLFRGMLLTRFNVLFGLKGRFGIIAASISQGIIFGAAHASQGATGIVMTGLIGTALGIYLMTRGKRSLIPLVISHGVIDTVVLALSWFIGKTG